MLEGELDPSVGDTPTHPEAVPLARRPAVWLLGRWLLGRWLLTDAAASALSPAADAAAYPDAV